jgi:[methyl-Co(III) methanol-specific corrinoid protein]:coenzyme M methyltransferase
VDYKTDLRSARQLAGQNVRIAGNISPIRTLLQGNAEDVRQSVINAVGNGIALVSPGCSLSPMTPGANVRAMVEAARELEYGRQHGERSLQGDPSDLNRPD